MGEFREQGVEQSEEKDSPRHPQQQTSTQQIIDICQPGPMHYAQYARPRLDNATPHSMRWGDTDMIISESQIHLASFWRRGFVGGALCRSKVPQDCSCIAQKAGRVHFHLLQYSCRQSTVRDHIETCSVSAGIVLVGFAKALCPSLRYARTSVWSPAA